MEITQAIRSHAAQPLTHQVLLSFLKKYKRPNDKVHELIRQGKLEAVKKGLYIAGPAIGAGKPDPFLLANHILGPSYISSDTALSYYGLIPERVYEISSATTKSSRSFETPMGLFSYTHLSLPYYAFGIQQAKLSDEQFALVASPEKTLFDKIVTTSGLLLRSSQDVKSYLLEDLRMDEDNLKEFDTKAMAGWLPDAPKRNSLLMIIKMIESL
jgi:hypothetical protein